MGSDYITNIGVANDDVTHRGAEDGMSPDKIVKSLSGLPTEDLVDIKKALDMLVEEKTTASAGHKVRE
jgi:hypothetical protein